MALNYWMQFIIWSVVIEFIKKLHFLNQAKVTYFHLWDTLPTYMHINWPSSNGFRRNSMLDMILSIYYHKPIFGHYKTTYEKLKTNKGMKRKAFSTVQPLKWWASKNLFNRLKSIGDKPAQVHPPHRPRRSVSRRTLRYTTGPPVPGTAGECHLWSTGTVVVLCSCAVRKSPLLTGSIWTQYHPAHRTPPAKTKLSLSNISYNVTCIS